MLSPICFLIVLEAAAATNFLHVLLTEASNAQCCQIPDILTNHEVFCHGPYPHGSTDCWQMVASRPWQKGSCADAGYKGPNAGLVSANASGQKDMFQCQWQKWDFDHPLGPEFSLQLFDRDSGVYSSKHEIDYNKGELRMHAKDDIPVSKGAGVPSHNYCLLDRGMMNGLNQNAMEERISAGNKSAPAELPRGPYTVKTDTIKNLPGLSQGPPYSAYIVYPEGKSSGEKFPFISFAHGTTSGGPGLLRDYADNLEIVASYGFIIVAAESCPQFECASGYCADQQQTIRACKGNPGLHSALANANFDAVGVFGHSMGAMATLGSVGGSKACKFDASLNIKAAVAQHPCKDGSLEASPVSLPIMFTAGSVDKICADGCSEQFFEQITKSPSKIMFDVKGANHFEPTSWPLRGSNSEVPAVAYFFACWLRNEQCDKVYGSSGQAICDQMPSGAYLHDCRVTGIKESNLIV